MTAMSSSENVCDRGNITALALFDMAPVALPPTEPVEKISNDRRRTLRQKADVAKGIHPLTRRRVHPDASRTCGSCRFREVIGHHSRSYPKCTFGDPTMPRATHSAASDVRAWWPGCGDHETAASEPTEQVSA